MITTLARTEHIADIPFLANSVAQLPTQGGQIPSDRWIKSLLLMMEFRITMPGANGPTANLADAPFSLVERVTVEGTYKPAGARPDKLWDIRGADLYEMMAMYYGIAPLLGGTAGGLGFVAGNSYDVRFVLPLPFVPMMVHPRLQIGYLLDAPRYDALRLTVQFGDAASIQTQGAAAPTFTAFGSAVGVPRLRVHGQFALAGASAFEGFAPGKVYRTFQEVTGSLATTTANDVRLFDIPKGDKIRSIMVKTGVRDVAVTAGNNAYNTLTDTMLARLRVFRGINKVNRSWQDYDTCKEDIALMYRRRNAQGYALMDWSPHGMDELLDLRALTGASGDTDVYVGADVTGVANQGVVFVTERWRGDPANIVPTRTMVGRR